MIHLPHLADLSGRAEALHHRQTPHVVVTVVRTHGPTAARLGSRALVLADGTLDTGFLGGGCVRSAVSRSARRALDEGRPHLLCLRPPDTLPANGAPDEPGRVYARNGCPSGAEIDMFIEPVLPRPSLLVCGDGPVARAVLDGARMLEVVPQGLSLPSTDSDALLGRTNPFDMVVLATQGNGDRAALTAAVSGAAEYIGFVASRRKFETLRAKLESDGIAAGALDRVRAPCGLDIGAENAEEIALSILAELVRYHRRPKDRP